MDVENLIRRSSVQLLPRLYLAMQFYRPDYSGPTDVVPEYSGPTDVFFFLLKLGSYFRSCCPGIIRGYVGLVTTHLAVAPGR